MSSNKPRAWYGDDPDYQTTHLQLVRTPNRYERHVKPILDIVVGSLLLVILAPVTLISMALTKMNLGGPVIYRQQRIGLGGETFELYKLRTMIADRREGDSPAYDGPERRSRHKSREDPRVVPIGAAMRALHLDELPQLWNVVKGEMSLVGPRPELPSIVAQYEDWQHQRHRVKPGLTGLWQVSAPGEKLMHECTEIDLEYISQISFFTDMSILLRTPYAMLKRRGY